jgi:hypothetical protein
MRYSASEKCEVASDTKLPLVSVKLTASSRGAEFERQHEACNDADPKTHREEYSIRNECFDTFIGGISPWIDGEKFFVMPIEAMLEFVIALQLLRPNTTTRSIVKWPDKIEQAFKKNNIKYEPSFDFNPKLGTA